MSETEAKIASLSVSADHHSKVLQQFSHGFIYLVSIFNIGAFTGAISLMATSVGTEIRQSHPYLGIWTLILFATGFIASILLMISIMAYSLNRYQNYRNLLRSGDLSKLTVDESIWRYGISIALAVITTLATVLAIIFAIYLVQDL